MSDRCEEIDEELHRFQEIYANNGKEVFRMALEIKELKEEIKKLGEAIQPYNDLSATMRVVVGFSKIVLAVGAIVGGYALIKKLFE